MPSRLNGGVFLLHKTFIVFESCTHTSTWTFATGIAGQAKVIIPAVYDILGCGAGRSRGTDGKFQAAPKMPRTCAAFVARTCTVLGRRGDGSHSGKQEFKCQGSSRSRGAFDMEN
ncbi:hypothetical protein FVEG_14862 [Fusarium verticillioides 7600]|uniref:Uncharacterized protein n=1 Tax=Gibberella moniliformis (strain M3125 / FGSC 7600) TaxID=334819 RepID=W7M047_GIBM7|nr:hypothetical protein FVEG_14862 [Fusarium verticillioides 7600]EWG38302.1 hypothetical protein FVEG_14862 [Fusarium verticillioides 7600]